MVAQSQMLRKSGVRCWIKNQQSLALGRLQAVHRHTASALSDFARNQVLLINRFDRNFNRYFIADIRCIFSCIKVAAFD